MAVAAVLVAGALPAAAAAALQLASEARGRQERWERKVARAPGTRRGRLSGGGFRGGRYYSAAAPAGAAHAPAAPAAPRPLARPPRGAGQTPAAAGRPAERGGACGEEEPSPLAQRLRRLSSSTVGEEPPPLAGPPAAPAGGGAGLLRSLDADDDDDDLDQCDAVSDSGMSWTTESSTASSVYCDGGRLRKRFTASSAASESGCSSASGKSMVSRAPSFSSIAEGQEEYLGGPRYGHSMTVVQWQSSLAALLQNERMAALLARVQAREAAAKDTNASSTGAELVKQLARMPREVLMSPPRGEERTAHEVPAHDDLKLVKELGISGICIVGGAILCMLKKFPALMTPGLLIIFFGAQTGMNMYMKAVFSSATVLDPAPAEYCTDVEGHCAWMGFQASFFVTGIQQFGGFIIFWIFFLPAQALGFNKLGDKEITIKKLTSKNEVIAVLCFAGSFTMNIALNNMSMALIPLTLNLIIRSCLPLSTFAAQWLLTKYTTGEGKPCKPIEIGLMMLGAAMMCVCVWAKIAAEAEGESHKKAGAGESAKTVIGVIYCVVLRVSLFSGSVNLALAGILKTSVKLDGFNTVVSEEQK
ncbi:unnamed protein product [Prorocentrum cordatum]|uniref:Uncharacterized protein n=1 Tax=Prorocentrum cordatum TaxID=2364126 RepID=A0ABN9VVK7_9DINO|nr:unnamed protein product [Polarella glacialis]